MKDINLSLVTTIQWKVRRSTNLAPHRPTNTLWCRVFESDRDVLNSRGHFAPGKPVHP
jgi:hypothetical protein